MTGMCKWFNNKKGYGFITDGDGKDYFVHHSDIRMDGYRTLKEGQEVSFEIQVDEKGLEKAVFVIPQ